MFIKSETSIRAIYLYTDFREKIRQFPQGGSCSSQMGTVTCLSCTCAFLARTYLKESLCALLQLPSDRFATSCGFGGPCWKMEMYVHGVVQGMKAATFQLAKLQWEINSSELCRGLEKTLLIYSDFISSQFLHGAEPQLAQ